VLCGIKYFRKDLQMAIQSNDPEAEKVFINNRKIPEGWKLTDWTFKLVCTK
jgi:hypothetical protein